MAKYEERARSRILRGWKNFCPIIQQAEQSGFNEADTSALVKDFIAEVLGFDKYKEITAEYRVRGHMVDYGIKMQDKLVCFVEVKAIVMALRERHVFQAVGYARNQGLEWVVLTNGRHWQCYHVPPKGDVELAFDIDLLSEADDSAVVAQLFLLSKEGLRRGQLVDFWADREALKPETLCRALLSPRVLLVLRRELARMVGRRFPQEALAECLLRDIVRGGVVEQLPPEVAESRIQRRESREKRHLPPVCFAYIGDPDDPKTWKLRYRKPDGTVHPRFLADAVEALSPGGFRGRKVEIPTESLASVRQNLRRAYEEIGKDIPPVLRDDS